MGFLNSVVLPEDRKLQGKSFKGNFLNSVVFSKESNRVASARTAATQASKDADKSQSLSGVVKTVASDLGSQLIQGPEKKLSSVFTGGTPEAGWNVISSALSDSAKRLEDWGKTISDPKASAVSKITKTGEVGMGWLNNAFTVVTAPLETARTIPVIGHVADVVSNIFSMAGKGSSDIGISGLNSLPISEKTKKEAAPLVGEIFALGGMIALGKGGEIVKSKFVAKSTELTNKVNEDMKVQLKILSEDSGTTKIPIKTPKTKHAEYARSQGYEPYTKPEDLPIIKFGERAKSTEPTVQLGDKISSSLPKGTRLVPDVKPTVPSYVPQVKGGFLESVTKPEQAPSVAPAASIADKSLQAVAPAAEVPSMKPSQGTGEMKESRLAAGVEELAIEKRLTEGFQGRPEYAQVSMKEQAKLAEDLRISNPEQATRIALGEELAPPHIIPEAIFVAVERAAIRRGDVATLQKLATGSELSLQATAMGQRIRTLGERDQLSPVKIISDIKKGREEAYEKKTGKSVEKARREEVATMKTEIRKNASKRPTWEEFIKEVQCGY